MKKLFCILAAVFFLSGSTLALAEVELGGLDKTASTAGIADAQTDPAASAATIVGWVLSFVGVIFLILMIYGGFLWMVSGGNDEQVKKAQQTIASAAIGLIIILSAYAITRYIGGAFGV